MRAGLILVGLLTACGGGGELPSEEKKIEVISPVVVVPPVETPPVETPPVVVPPPPVVVAPPVAETPPVVVPPVVPVVVPPPPVVTPSPKTLWAETWTAPIKMGYVVQTPIDCKGKPDDPQTLEAFALLSPGDTWASFGTRAQVVDGIISISQGQIEISSIQSSSRGGWALLTAQQFSPEQPLTLEGKVTLQPDPGAWVSLPLIAGEGDYRQISLREDNGNITADLGAPCYYKPLATFPPGERKLTLSYHPKDGWTYSIDGVILHREPLSHAGANLTGPVRVGIYIVNVGVEGLRQPSGLVRVSIGTLTLTE